jgi:hypothetical protein
MARLQLYDFEGTWWRCKISLEDQTLTPIPPFEPYNPFKAYIPYGRATQREERSLLYEFLRVNLEDVNEIVTFCERFGVLGPVKEIKGLDDFVLDESIYTAKAIADLPDWTLGKHLDKKFGMKPLDRTPAMTAFTLDEFRRVHQLLTRAVKWGQQTKQSQDMHAARQARQFLCYVTNYKLKMVRPRLNWDEQAARWGTAWDLRSLEGALYLMLLFDIQSPGTILTCPWCHHIFLGDHPRTVFCSLRCQNAHKAKVFRERHARKVGKGITRRHSNVPTRKVTHQGQGKENR